MPGSARFFLVIRVELIVSELGSLLPILVMVCSLEELSDVLQNC